MLFEREEESEYAHSLGPTFELRVDDDMIWKGIRFGRGDGRNVVFVSVDDVDYLESSLLQALFHGAAHL